MAFLDIFRTVPIYYLLSIIHYLLSKIKTYGFASDFFHDDGSGPCRGRTFLVSARKVPKSRLGEALTAKSFVTFTVILLPTPILSRPPQDPSRPLRVPEELMDRFLYYRQIPI